VDVLVRVLDKLLAQCEAPPPRKGVKSR